jgi:predicted membrane protein DUF2306
MSTVASSGQVMTSGKGKTPNLAAKLLGSAVILVLAIAFVRKYVFHYYLNYNPDTFNNYGAPNYWAMRGWLLMHMTGGMVVLLTGVAIGSIGAFRMAINTTFGWAFGFALIGLATASVTTAGMAFYAILNGQIQIRKEWMVRAYVVTFAVVTFRVLSHYGSTSHLQPVNDKLITIAWRCWAIPLLITNIILQLRRMRSSASPQ